MRWLFPFVRLHGAGNEVIMLLMGRDKQADQCMSTIAGQERPPPRAGLATLKKW